MCGIAGLFMRNGPLSSEPLYALSKALTHRGPDGSGIYQDDVVGLVHTRLAIIDPEHGQQPFVSDNGNVVLVANGEIYNDLELRKLMHTQDFATASDCEPPLYLYKRVGQTYAERLRGMYAIAVYDQAARQLILSRDPFGIKSLYYVATDDYFAFASEPQALIRAGLARIEIDAVRRAELLQLQFTTGSGTIFPDIHRVLPGQTLVVRNGEIGRVIDKGRFEANVSQYANPVDQLGHVLKETVATHMRADVPYGLFLSGGIDSSALLAAMNIVSAKPVVAVTAAFPELPAKDESEKATQIARLAGAEHHIVSIAAEDFWDHAPKLAAALDDPTCDSSALPIFLLAKAARALGLKVVLSGEGADEMFAGYKRYRRARWLFGLWREKTRKKGVITRSPECHGALANWRDGIEAAERQPFHTARSGMQRLQAIDCAEWLPNDLLLKLDRCLMAHGVEGRTPYLDEKLSPFAYHLPDNLKVKGKQGKWLLRAWLDRTLPGSDPWSRKQGFIAPVGHWMSLYGERLLPLLLNHPAFAGMEADGIVRSAFGPTGRTQAAWSLLFYALWYSHHVMNIDPAGSIDDVLSMANS